MRPDAQDKEAGKTDGRLGTLLHQTYRLERVLGVGGMGTVYAGRHVHLGHGVAVKVLHPHVADQRVALERFRREAQIASQLGHPGLVSVLDFNSTDDGAPYMVMELLEGQTLQERLARGALPLDETCALFSQLCDALHAVHEAGIVHRDLKPENIFLLAPPETELKAPRGWTGQQSPWGAPLQAGQRVKILDFGISKFQPQRPEGAQPGIELTSGLEVLGTPSYLAPEQATGDAHEADRRADVFSLGTILYECLTGQRAFEGPHPVAIMRAMLTDPVPRPSERVPDLPPALDDVIARACAKGPASRYDSARELKEAIFGAAGAGALPPPPAPAAAEEASSPFGAVSPSAVTAPPAAAAWDNEGDTLFDAEVDALRHAAREAYDRPVAQTPTPVIVPPSVVTELAEPEPTPTPADVAPHTIEVRALPGGPELTMTDSGAARTDPPDERGEAVTRRPTDRPTALLDTLPIPPEGYAPQSRWAQGHDATIDIRHLTPARRPGGAPQPSRGSAGARSWLVTASTAALAVLLGVVVGMLVLKLMSRGTSPSLALERAQQLQRQLVEAEALAAQGRCEGALGRVRAVLQVEPGNERALAVQRTCRK